MKFTTLSATLALAVSITATAKENVTLRVDAFQSITCNAPANLVLLQNPDSVGYITYAIDESVKDKIHFEVKDDQLVIKLDEGNYTNFDKKMSVVRIHMAKPLSGLVINGSGDIDARAVDCADSFSATINGSGDISLNDCKMTDCSLTINGSGDINLAGDNSIGSLNSAINGSGDIRISGTADFATYSIAGSGDIKCHDLTARVAKASVNGSGNIKCYAQEMVEASCTGTGNVSVKGNPPTYKLSGKKNNITIN